MIDTPGRAQNLRGCEREPQRRNPASSASAAWRRRSLPPPARRLRPSAAAFSSTAATAGCKRHSPPLCSSSAAKILSQCSHPPLRCFPPRQLRRVVGPRRPSPLQRPRDVSASPLRGLPLLPPEFVLFPNLVACTPRELMPCLLRFRFCAVTMARSLVAAAASSVTLSRRRVGL